MAGCSKCGEKFCACNVEDTLSVSHTGDGSTASPWLFNVRVDSDATNLLSLGANGLLTKFYGADGAGTTVAGAGTLTDPFIVDIDTSEIDLCQIVGNASVTVGCPPCDGEIIYCFDGVTYKLSLEDFLNFAKQHIEANGVEFEQCVFDVSDVLVGSAVVKLDVDCDGVEVPRLIINYFGSEDVFDTLQNAGDYLGACPTGSGSSLSLVDVDGGAVVSGDNVLRSVLKCGASPVAFNTDGNGSQIVDFDKKMVQGGLRSALPLTQVSAIGTFQNFPSTHLQGSFTLPCSKTVELTFTHDIINMTLPYTPVITFPAGAWSDVYAIGYRILVDGLPIVSSVSAFPQAGSSFGTGVPAFTADTSIEYKMVTLSTSLGTLSAGLHTFAVQYECRSNVMSAGHTRHVGISQSDYLVEWVEAV